MFNPVEMRRPNTPETKVSDSDKSDSDIKASIPIKSMPQIWSVMLLF